MSSSRAVFSLRRNTSYLGILRGKYFEFGHNYYYSFGPTERLNELPIVGFEIEQRVIRANVRVFEWSIKVHDCRRRAIEKRRERFRKVPKPLRVYERKRCLANSGGPRFLIRARFTVIGYIVA